MAAGALSIPCAVQPATLATALLCGLLVWVLGGCYLGVSARPAVSDHQVRQACSRVSCRGGTCHFCRSPGFCAGPKSWYQGARGHWCRVPSEEARVCGFRVPSCVPPTRHTGCYPSPGPFPGWHVNVHSGSDSCRLSPLVTTDPITVSAFCLFYSVT